MRKKTHIAIAGAGIGGLVAGLALLRRGFRVRIYEQAPELAEVGAGLQLSSNAVRGLFGLGLSEALLAKASVAQGKCVRLWNTGQTWKLFDLGAESVETYGFPYLMMHRADMHRILVDAFRAADPEALRLGARLERFEAGDGVTLHFADGTRETADLLIGADGVHSVVRSQLFGADSPEFSGCMAWRGVAEMSSLPEGLRQTIGTNWIGPRGHVIQYPLRSGRLMNFVGIVERDDWQVESWNVQGTAEECHADFAGWNDAIHKLIDAVGQPMKWALMLRRPLPQWSVGPVTLLGDAAHPTLPFLAQGACMAIEDAVVLARALDAHDGVAEAAFPAYEAARLERTTAIVNGSAENAKRFHNPRLADAEGAASYVTNEWSREKVAARYDWLFEYNVDTVAV